MLEYSEVTNKYYEAEDTCFFRNIIQSAFYIDHGVLPLDVFTGSDGKLVIAFSKEDHRKMIPLWNANKKEHEKEENNHG